MELACKNLYIFSCDNRCHARFILKFLISILADNYKILNE
jgi:hypothetical protein